MLMAGEGVSVDYEGGQQGRMDVPGGCGAVDCNAGVRLPDGIRTPFLLPGDDAGLRFAGVDGAEQLLRRTACA